MAILDSLTDPAAAPAMAQPMEIPAQDEDAPFRAIQRIAIGEVPGAYIPADIEPITNSALTPDALARAGVLIYKPKTPGVLAVVFNPDVLPVKTLREADLAGRLTEVLPPITQVAGGSPETPVETPATEEPEMPVRVPVLPRPTFNADAQERAAAMRMKSLGGTEPSARPLPGAGQILNGLLKRAI